MPVFPGQQCLISDAFAPHSVDIQRLEIIILTHQDIDHIGSAAAIAQTVTHKVRILCDPIEKPYIEGEKRLAKLTPEAIEAALRQLPPTMSTDARNSLRFALEHPPSVKVDGTFYAEEDIAGFGGLKVIKTYGHTPGHVAIYHRSSRCVVLGDCVEVIDGRLCLPEERLCSDFEQAKSSLKNLLEYDIDLAIAYHGGLIEKKVRSQIESLTK